LFNNQPPTQDLLEALQSVLNLFSRLARTIQHPWPQARGMLNESAVPLMIND